MRSNGVFCAAIMNQLIKDKQRLSEINALRTAGGHQSAALLLAEDRLQQLIDSQDADPSSLLDWMCLTEQLRREAGCKTQADNTRALVLSEATRQFGAYSRGYATVLERLATQLLGGWHRGSLNDSLYECDQAKSLLIQALDIREKALRPPAELVLDVVRTATALSKVHESLREEGAATSNLQYAISRAEDAVGQDHIEVARLLVPLSRLYRLEHRHESSVRVAREALRIAQLHGSSTVDVAIAQNSLGIAMVHAGNLVEGNDFLRCSFEMARRLEDLSDADFADISYVYGEQLVRLKRWNEALVCLSIAVERYQRYLLPDHRRRLDALVLLSMCWAGSGNVSAARKILQDAYRVVERCRHGSPEIEEEFASICVALATAYVTAGDQREADRLLAYVDSMANSYMCDTDDFDSKNEEEQWEAEDSDAHGRRLKQMVGPAMVRSLLASNANDDALQLVESLLELKEAEFSDEDLLTSELLSLVHFQRGDLAEAVVAASKALSLCEELEVIDELKLAELLLSHAVILRTAGHGDEATVSEERGKAIYLKVRHAFAVP
jgi:tetratricopeptide (TPR) repeat protein